MLRTQADEISPEEVRRAVETLCASKTFGKAQRLQIFLQYVSEATLRGEGDQVKESVLATEVFGRKAGYDPQQDSVVRRQAHALRQKLKSYYESEGKDDDVCVDLPVGRYIPLYRRRTLMAATAEVPAEMPKAQKKPLVVWGVVLLAVAGLAVLGRWVTTPKAEVYQSNAMKLWAPFLSGSNGPLLCFATRRVAVVRHYSQTGPLARASESDLASPKDDARFRKFFELPRDGSLYLTPSLAETKVAEAMSAVRIATLLGRLGKPLRTTESRFMNWEVLRRENVILLGDVEGSPWATSLLQRYPVKLQPADGHRAGTIEVGGKSPAVFVNMDSGSPRNKLCAGFVVAGCWARD